MDIQDDHFALFGLAPRFALDRAALDDAYRALQSRVHPDRFAGASAAEQRVALQWATRANEAFQTLRDPLQRATYLCTLRGEDPTRETDTRMPPDFLMQQLEWREALDEASDRGALDALSRDLEARRSALQAEVAAALDDRNDATEATGLVRQWMFVERFGEDVDAALDRHPDPVH